MSRKNIKQELFDSDSEVSDEEISTVTAANIKNQSNDLYQENFHKYINRLKELTEKIDDIEEKAFGDGIWYVNHPLISISQINYEKNLGIFDIINMDEQENGLMYKKLLVVFTFIDNEIEKITELFQLNLYDNLLMYGEEANDKPAQERESPEIMTAKMLAVYRKVYDLVKKLMAYIENLILQLHSIINRKSTVFKTHFKSVSYDPMFDLIGRALRSIYVIDCIVQNNALIDEHWEKYMKMLKLARNEPDKFGMTLTKVKKIEKHCGRLEKTILSKECMKTITEIVFDESFEKSSNPLGRIRQNKDLREYFEDYFERKLKGIEESFGSPTEIDEERKLLDLMCNYALYRKLFPEEEGRDMWRKLWAIQKKIPIIEAHSFVCVYICIFMQEVAPLQKKSKTMDPANETAFLKSYMVKLEESLGLEIVSYYTKFCVWLSRMESVATSNSSLRGIQNREKDMMIVNERLSNRVVLLVEGFNLVLKLNKLLYLCLTLHTMEGRPLKHELLGKLILGMETVKAASYILRKKTEAFDTMVMTRILTKDLVNVVEPIYNRLYREESGRKDRENLEKLQVLKMMLILLKGPVSEQKLTLLKYSYSFIANWAFREEERNYIVKSFEKIEIIFYNQILIQKYENFSYLYFCKDLLPSIFVHKIQNPNTCKRLQFLFEAFEDPAYLVKKCVHLTNSDELFLEFKKFLINKFEDHYMSPLKSKVEDFLRISIHCMLIEKIEGIKPFEREMTDIMKLVQFEKIRIFDSVVDLKFEISNSFNNSFYNLNIINMHDMETYEQMKILASHIFGLRLHDTYLPSQTIEQNKFDILKIIKNIPEFINTYKYNLLTQKFLEITGENKIITSIGIQQLSDSIKTHGLGILSTSVNIFYRFLIVKVQAFSKFLYNENIKNLLSKEKKWFKDYTETKDYPGYYPYERALGFYKDVKKLGKFEDETNYLDKFREIVSAVGNALGFIRLLRSASLNSSSKLIEYLPKKQEIGETFEELSQKSEMSESTINCCKELDDILKSLEEKFGDKIDYLNVMIKACSKISSKENKHLKQFYLIIPALSINYVEYMARGKEQINKKIASKAFLYDDGFTLGLSFFINLLNQHEYVKILHWNDSTQSYFESMKNYSKSYTDPSQHSAKFIEDLNMQQMLLVKKLESMSMEFTMFDKNLQSANVLFKGGAVTKDQKNSPTSPPSGDSTQQSGENNPQI